MESGQPMRTFAFFDVDGTVIAQDSFLLLLRVTLLREPWRVLPLLLFSPIFLFTAFLKCDKRMAKSAVLWSVTCFRSKRATVTMFRTFVEEHLVKLWFREASDQLQKLREQGVEICYVSASGQIWLRQLLRITDPSPKVIIGSRLGFCCGGVTMKSPNCYNKEKLLRIATLLGNELVWEAAFSDHPADLPMLLKARQRFVVSPKTKHLPRFVDAMGKSFYLLRWRDPTQQP